MMQKRLTKELLSDLVTGNTATQMNTDILNTLEVQQLMLEQWENPGEVRTTSQPDYKKIYNNIKTGNREVKRISSDISIIKNEVDDLRNRYVSLRRRFRTAIGIAASIILLFGIATLFFIKTNQVFRKTYTENIAPQGQKSSVILPDGTKAYLNSGSAIRYDNFFGKKYRNVQLVGEAYFEVSHNEKLPFIINTDVVQIEVLGTKFNVMAYPDENIVETIVTEGKVSVTEINGQSTTLLNANQKATFHKKTKKLVINEVDPELYTSWKENLLTFDNENFANVIKKLERWYDVSITVEGTDTIKDRFTLTIKSESLREVLELISLTTNIEYKIDGNKVTITYK